MHMKSFDEAERLLVEASQKNSNDAATMCNLITVAQHLQKPSEVINRQIR
jgi:hypothetical protein